MTISNFKIFFFKELKPFYPQTEIQSFFTILMDFKLNLSRTNIALNPQIKISEEDFSFLENSLQKLKENIPIQYIIGETEFYGNTFKVNPSVLIPRPETEELVDWIIASSSSEKHLNILDIGTGSGCIAISLAKKLPNATVFAIDISSEALQTATQNAKINDVSVNFLEIDILKSKKLPAKFDVIVSNPPYVRELEKQQMQQNVLNNEPHLALFVKDNNSLIFYEKIAELAHHYLSKNGSLYFEINQYLGNETKNLVKQKGFEHIELKKDIFGVDRMLKAKITK